MAPVPPETFASELRDLGASRRAGFVAALWAARGWETTVDGETVLAERDGKRRRLRVVDPGWFRTPDLDGVDTLVVARDRDRVRSAAEGAGVEYVTPTELRDRLLYALERGTAASLYEEWFDRPLQRTVEDAGRDWSLDALTGSLPVVAGNRRLLVTVLLVVLGGVVLAGPMLSGGETADQPEITVGNVTPAAESAGAIGAATSTATPTAIPTMAPGLSEAGVVDPEALTRAHVEGVANRSRTVRWTLDAPGNESSGRSVTARNATAWIENGTSYRYENVATVSVPNRSFQVRFDRYADGESAFERATFLERTTYSRVPASEEPASTVDAEVRSMLYRYFAGAENTIVRCAIRYDTDCPTYRVEIDGNPPTALQGNVSDYEALAIVSETGVITTIRVEYTLPDGDGERAPVSFALDYRFEAVDVSPPEWLEAARNATATAGGNGTATPTPTR